MTVRKQMFIPGQIRRNPMPKYVRIVSWHVVRNSTRVPRRVVTVCGRNAWTDEVSDTLPLEEKSCETCLRLTTR